VLGTVTVIDCDPWEPALITINWAEPPDHCTVIEPVSLVD
jgi:hypothetical protein